MWKAITLGLTLSLLARSAHAQLARPAAGAPAPAPAEVPLGTLQVTLGFLGTLVSFAPALAVINNNDAAIAAAFATLAPVPLVTGSIICGIGHMSRQYTGGCGAPILGAYLGSLTAIPLAYLLCKSRQNRSGTGDEGGLGCVGGILFGLVIGEAIGGTIGATIGWHLAKHPRAGDERLIAPPAPPPARADDWPEVHLRPARSTPPGTSVSVPLLALAF